MTPEQREQAARTAYETRNLDIYVARWDELSPLRKHRWYLAVDALWALYEEWHEQPRARVVSMPMRREESG